MNKHQKFWGIVNNKTSRVSRNMSGYNIFPTRESARQNMKAQMKSKKGNYHVELLYVEVETASGKEE